MRTMLVEASEAKTASRRHPMLHFAAALVGVVAATLLMGVVLWENALSVHGTTNPHALNVPRGRESPNMAHAPKSIPEAQLLAAAEETRQQLLHRIRSAQQEMSLTRIQMAIAEEERDAVALGSSQASRREELASILLETDRLADRLADKKPLPAYGCRLIVEKFPESSLADVAQERLQDQGENQ